MRTCSRSGLLESVSAGCCLNGYSVVAEYYCCSTAGPFGEIGLGCLAALRGHGLERAGGPAVVLGRICFAVVGAIVVAELVVVVVGKQKAAAVAELEQRGPLPLAVS